MARFQSVAHLFRNRVAKTPQGEAFSYPVGERWESITWAQTGAKVDLLAAGLRSLGLEDENRVGVLCGTRVEWLLADLATLVAGGATTTIYPS